MAAILHSARVVSDGTETPDAWLRLADGRIADRGTGRGWEAAAAPGDDVLDAREVAGEGAVVTPGFVDIHTHGAGGGAHDAGLDGIVAARAVHRAHGTTRAVVSLVTAGVEELAHRVSEIASLTAQDPEILGSHLEGPFLDPGHHGAHDTTLLREPAPAVVERLLRAGRLDGRPTVRQITLAPELRGGLDAIRTAVRLGTAAAIGHTAADARRTEEAILAGATILTHAFNAMPGIHHREPGPIPVAARSPRVTLELIADGVHVHDDVVRLAFAAAPGRVALITDAMAATGMGDGAYRLGALDVDVVGGVARVRGTDTIAGSTLTQDAALRRAVGAGVPLPTAVDALTRVPARAIGERGIGSLAVGSVADAVLLDAALAAVRGVWVAGRPI
ncbi:N-acetylglucosamine-6-phosphate deacetylase [Microbacterium marinilacus]|uniref:N-acetylglucosamine-6-phosphate deacetylase n=1 Tax=Microbacterium marinilacus TaxID=415209 RepID=A0ABP7BAM6_9MICO|nr:amidohydrolase family protein [Microbacterium marinilacus]MBY0687069.1 amidohydrolase family protein [Microbacterium marinilacus]